MTQDACGVVRAATHLVHGHEAGVKADDVQRLALQASGKAWQVYEPGGRGCARGARGHGVGSRAEGDGDVPVPEASAGPHISGCRPCRHTWAVPAARAAGKTLAPPQPPAHPRARTRTRAHGHGEGGRTLDERGNGELVAAVGVDGAARAAHIIHAVALMAFAGAGGGWAGAGAGPGAGESVCTCVLGVGYGGPSAEAAVASGQSMGAVACWHEW